MVSVDSDKSVQVLGSKPSIQLGTARFRLYWVFILVGVAVVAGLVWLTSSHTSPVALGTTLSATGALGVITGGAVVIERALEASWTIADMLSRGRWLAGPQIKQMLTTIASKNGEVTKAIASLDAIIDKVDTANKEAVTKVGVSLDRLASVRDGLKVVASAIRADLPTIGKALDRTNEALDDLFVKCPDAANEKAIRDALSKSSIAIGAVESIVATFDSNPARRLVSIVAGANLGLLIAWSLDLNAFTVAAPVAGANPAPLASWACVAVTGLVMGLGSTPTHELIRAIQQQKQTP